MRLASRLYIRLRFGEESRWIKSHLMSASRRDAGSGWAALATAPSQSSAPCPPPPQPSQHILFSIFTCHIITSSSYVLSSFFFCICIFISLISCPFPSPASSTFILRIHPYFLSPNFPFFFVTLFSPLLFFSPFSSHFCLIFPFSLLSFLDLLLFHILYFNIFSSSLLLSPCFSVVSSPLSFFCSSFRFLSSLLFFFVTSPFLFSYFYYPFSSVLFLSLI